MSQDFVRGDRSPLRYKKTSEGQTHAFSARSLFGLTCGLFQVDSLIGGLKHDTVALLTGSDAGLQAAERYCVRAQLPEVRGGLGGGAFFIDGGNSFDVYLFTELARKYHLDYDVALSHQLISRAFTIYELRSLVKDSIAVFEKKERPKLLIISEIFSLFTEDVDKAEGEATLRDIASSISELSETRDVPIFITSTRRPKSLTSILEEKCNVSAQVVGRKDSGTLELHLYKHPTKSVPFELRRWVRQGRPFNQDVLQATDHETQTGDASCG